ncbi:MFS transporter [Pseudoduganella ginsengisoli]|uniref:MFS transporter n=1 Tax=Pseudoduganella ginsengisoli TaxID=1462440 RepID=A0A6L6PU52_9BURK|nr:MFS transporter [Pseudoduganella ginsengisoli]MTW00769.1 MFS transporter [Pseudoduganella ginsengisoli]
MTSRRIIAATLAGHFAAAFAALGMPPFYDRILRETLHSGASWLAGWFFVIPTLLAALSNPWWGALADRYGKKRLLLRAHLGLAVSFWLTSLADNVWQFGAALALQGILGGTFAASNAYLATVASGHRLTRLLTLMQGSARAALFAGPALMGVLSQGAQPLQMYRWLALLPLLSAALVWCMPAPPSAAATPPTGRTTTGTTPPVAPAHVYALNFAFIFGTVITFPYFVPFAEHALADLPPSAPGWLFGLPHLAYLLFALPMTPCIGRRRLLPTLLASQALLAAALLGQAHSHDLPTLIVLRSLMGAAMTACYIALHGLVAAITDAGNAGRRFGSLEASTKWGAVAAGAMAGGAATQWGPHAPFLIGAAAIGLSTTLIFIARPRRACYQPPARSTD